MAIEFSCDSCHQLVRTPDQTAGKKGRCPFCQAVVQIPLKSVAAPVASPKPAATAAPATTGATITFACSSCGKTNRAPAAMAGKKGRCPGCKAVVEIPANSPKPAPRSTAKPAHAAVAAAPAQPALQPLAPLTSSSPGLTPLGPSGGIPGLAPLGNPGGLQPLDGFPGIQPLDGGLPGLQPLGGPSPLGPANDPFASLGPTTGNPFGAPASGNPFGDAAFGPTIPNPLGGGTTLAPNPYSAPSAAAYKPSQELDDPRQRRGFPWQKEQDFDAFSETVKRVLFSFPTAFQHMRVYGGIGSALGFIVSAQIVAVVINACYSLMLQIALMAFLAMENPEAAGAAIVGALIGFVMQLVFGSMFAAIVAMIGSFIAGGISHLCLLVVGAANRGFDTTYQVVCYASGACALLVLIPILGPLVSIFLMPVILIFGFMHAHGTSGLRATFAVLLPYLLCFAAIAFAVFSIFAAVMSRMAEMQ